MQLKIDGLLKQYNDLVVLNNVQLNLSEVHSLVLIGPSGGGKTTLLRILAGLEYPDAGTVAINGKQLLFREEELVQYRKRVGMVFQAYNLFPHLTAIDNIVLPLVHVHHRTVREAQDLAMQLLRRFQLEIHANKKPSQLSGGQKQRVAIARAIAIRPDFLLFDEPTSALDPEFTAEVLDMIEELKYEEIDLILVTHEMGFAKRVSDHVLFIAEGGVLEEGSATEVFDSPKHPLVKQFLNKVLKY